MARPTLDEINALPDGLTTEGFELLFPELPGGGNPAPLRVKCQSVEIPNVTVEQVQMILHGKQVNFAGKRTPGGQMSVSFIETSDMQTYSALAAWAEFCRGTNSGLSQGYKAAYSKTVRVNIEDTTGAIVGYFDMFGTWPTEVPTISLEGQGGEIMQIQAQFSVDYHRSNLFPYQ